MNDTTEQLTREAILAMPAGDEMDRLVAERVFGFRGLGYYGPPESGRYTHANSRWFATPEEADAAYAAYWDREHAGDPRGFVDRDDWESKERLCWWKDDWGPFAVSDYSTLVWHAWEVVDHLKTMWMDHTDPASGIDVEFKDGCRATADTVPLAICRAALLTTL